MTVHTPLRCANSSMVQRGTHEVVLLDTGSYPSYSDFLNETWTWNGTDWTNTSTSLVNANGPLPGRINSAIAYDGTNVMLFGGQASNSQSNGLNDTWVWNGTVWTQKTGIGFSTTTPTQRWGATASNHNTNQTILFGGTNTLYKLLETWLWNGSTQTWSQIVLPNGSSPAARTDHMMAGNTAGVTLLFGGQGTNSQFNDTWTFNGAVWNPASPTVSPSVRSDACMAYDTTNSIWVMFGGKNEYNYLPETWIYKAGTTNNWSQVTVPAGTGPAGRIGAQMCFDSQSGKTLMFGGITATANYPSNETWVFDGASQHWSLL